MTPLTTTFLSSTQLDAVVPTALLTSACKAEVVVLTYVGQEDVPRSMTNGVSFTVATPSPGEPRISSISPASATVGSSATIATITGTNFDKLGTIANAVYWSDQCCDTWLDTTFVSETQLTAVIPAAFLLAPTTAYLHVVTGDWTLMSPDVYLNSNSVPFVVTP